MDSAHNKVYKMGVYGTWYGRLPDGCIYCMKGSKAVIFLSGICGVSCYYCPLSLERRRYDAFYVDEERFRGVSDIIDEIAAIRAEGASITGGEPFQMYYITVDLISILKDVFGSRFHIHLYTSGYGVTKAALRRLYSVGLDEIRFHVVNDSVFNLVRFAVRETDMDVGIEIPAIPDAEWLWRIVVEADGAGAKFVNLNELEVSETNIEGIFARGFRVREDGRSVERSYDVALNIIERASREGLGISIHLCPAIYKDVVQHRNRLKRKAITCAGPDTSINDDGTVDIGGKDVIPMFDVCSDYVDLKQSNRKKCRGLTYTG